MNRRTSLPVLAEPCQNDTESSARRVDAAIGRAIAWEAQESLTGQSHVNR